MAEIIQSILEGTIESEVIADLVEGEFAFSNDSEFQKFIYRLKNEGGPATYENSISETWLAKTDSITAGGTGSGSDLVGVDNTNFSILSESDAQKVFEEIDILINDVLAGNVALLDVNQEFTGVNTFSNSLIVTGSFISSGLTYPVSDGTNGQVMTTNGVGTLSFSNAATPGGADGDLQFKTGTTFTGGGPNWDGSDLTITGDIILGSSNTVGFDNGGGLSFDSADNGIFSANLRVGGIAISRPDSDNASSLSIYGGSSVGGTGGRVNFYGPSNGSKPGNFELANGTDIIIDYDGTTDLLISKATTFLFKSNNSPSSNQVVVFTSEHPTDGEEDVLLLLANNILANPHTLALGGSDSTKNAIQLGAGYAAPNNITLSGTQIFTWDINGFNVITGDLKMNNGPTISTGSGVPVSAEPNASLFLRTDGTGPNLYVRENGAWISK